jgi:tRNA modification GTPase
VRRARAELAHADLILELRDGSTSQPPDSEFEQPLFEQPRIVVHSKCDLGPEPARLEWHPRGASRECHIWLSALTGAGLDLLRAALAQEARGGEGTTGTFSARARHVAALDRCGQHLDSAVQPLAETKAGELLAEDLRQAQLALDEITGVHTSDDLLGEIFSSFCIGK